MSVPDLVVERKDPLGRKYHKVECLDALSEEIATLRDRAKT